MCFVVIETKLKTRKTLGKWRGYINNSYWLGLSGIKCFVAVEAQLKTGVPNCSMLKGMHITYYGVIV
jgi:hypothetical protein